MSAFGPAFYFNLHGLIKARVSGPGWLMAPVIRELSHHRIDPVPEHELDLEILLNPPGQYPQENLTSWTGSHLAARWQVKVAAGEHPVKVFFRGNLASRFIVSKWIVEPAVRIELEKKGALMTHAAAVTDGERSMLLAGAGGAGKTSWVLSWLAAGHPYVSDDFSIIYVDKVMSYVTPLRLGFANIRINKLLHDLPLTNRIEIIIRTIVRRGSLGVLKFYFKISIKNIDPQIKIKDVSNLDGAILLDNVKSKDSIRTRRIEPSELASKMTEIDRAEMHGFAGPGMSDEFWTRHGSGLSSALSGKPCLVAPGRRLPPAEAVSSITSLMDWVEKG